MKLLGPLWPSAASDLGGFGSASHPTWQWPGTLDLRPWSWRAIRAGHRNLDVDHGGFAWDRVRSGPILWGRCSTRERPDGVVVTPMGAP